MSHDIIIETFFIVLAENDPWLEYCSAAANPQLLFVIGDAWSTSPFPRVSNYVLTISITFQ